MNEAAFFKTVRTRLGILNQGQVNGLNTLLAAAEGAPLSHAAYMLATAWHETAKTMQPIRERGGTAYFTRMYDVAGERPKTCIAYGNTCAGDGPRYYGRGYVQLTWKVNYAKAGEKLGVDLVGNPDLAMNAELAAKIMRRGMDEGWFSGKKLSDYLPASGTATREQYVAARRIINGTDRAELVEDYAQAFERALRDGGWA
ncbi:glycoside hydrolase family 19 protein [Sphingomonas sp. 1P08PE]|uniref:glycoside hydrolase family 19 protein n=1 Tax=Sphingomonas sp. 1P08PE TaxID=554122 RepID=UPI0039A1DCA8